MKSGGQLASSPRGEPTHRPAGDPPATQNRHMTATRESRTSSRNVEMDSAEQIGLAVAGKTRPLALAGLRALALRPFLLLGPSLFFLVLFTYLPIVRVLHDSLYLLQLGDA